LLIRKSTSSSEFGSNMFRFKAIRTPSSSIQEISFQGDEAASISVRAKPKVAIVADNASKEMGGEAIIPYHYYRVMRSRGIDVWLIVHERVREELEAIFPGDKDKMVFIKDLSIQKWYWKLLGDRLPHRLNTILVAYPIDLVNQFRQRRIIKELVKNVGINIVHQPTPVSPKLASMIFGVGASVVIGPMNGGMTYPPDLLNKGGFLEKVVLGFGRYFSNLTNVLIPGKRSARVLLVANERTYQALPNTVSHNIIHLVENGVDTSLWRERQRQPESEIKTPKFIFIGRLVDWKGVDLLLEAMKKVLGKRSAELCIIGDGNNRKQLEALSETLRISRSVSFLGYKTQDECADELGNSTALVLPSLYECGGAVVLEAMCSSRPVIATKWGGPVDYLTEDCGILVEPKSRPALVAGIANAMLLLADNPSLCRKMGERGRLRVIDKFDWEKKLDQVLMVYNLILSSEGPRPSVYDMEIYSWDQHLGKV
jgi:glycosyltransferase involved in cell wall biosynthesis